MRQRYPIKGWCGKCNDTVRGKITDNGIGAYEYWGFRGVDKQIVIVCDECEEPLEDFEEMEPCHFPCRDEAYRDSPECLCDEFASLILS